MDRPYRSPLRDRTYSVVRWSLVRVLPCRRKEEAGNDRSCHARFSADDNNSGFRNRVMFAIVFCWTPAHFWALAMRYRDDYERAGIPMLPVRHSPRAAAKQIAAYAVVTSAVTLLLGLTITVGVLYVAAAVVLGAIFVGRAFLLVRDPEPVRAIQFFAWSNVYLMLVFVAVALDTLLR